SSGRAYGVATRLQQDKEIQPWAGRRNMVGRRLSLRLDEQRQLLEVLPVPLGKRLQQLEPLAGRRNVHLYRLAVLGRGDEAFRPLGKPLAWQFVALRRFELQLRAVRGLQ